MTARGCQGRARTRRGDRGGFTLAEVMIALAILGLGLTMLVRSIAGNISSAQEAMYMGIVADVGRGKMYDIEEHLAQEGFKDTEEHDEGTFEDEGWPAIKWEYRVIPVELPSFEKLMGMDKSRSGSGSGSGSRSGGSGSGSGSDQDGDGEPDPEAVARFQDSALGKIMDMFGGGLGGGDLTTGAAGANIGMVQMVYPMIQDVLKKSIRKIVLTIRWDTGFEAEHIDFVLYVTDPAAMCKAIPGGIGCKS
ncbi:MAG TPA: prepilin-type N-terminal cleavage/methylation domain-containing protein [Kofleriaceae bacterium]|nr:prepilin-type N-terminal cleavage/methylation domain-containing protein [Kofleriaceae bacterium]